MLTFSPIFLGLALSNLPYSQVLFPPQFYHLSSLSYLLHYRQKDKNCFTLFLPYLSFQVWTKFFPSFLFTRRHFKLDSPHSLICSLILFIPSLLIPSAAFLLSGFISDLFSVLFLLSFVSGICYCYDHIKSVGS